MSARPRGPLPRPHTAPPATPHWLPTWVSCPRGPWSQLLRRAVRLICKTKPGTTFPLPSNPYHVVREPVSGLPDNPSFTPHTWSPPSPATWLWLRSARQPQTERKRGGQSLIHNVGQTEPAGRARQALPGLKRCGSSGSGPRAFTCADQEIHARGAVRSRNHAAPSRLRRLHRTTAVTASLPCRPPSPPGSPRLPPTEFLG